MTKLTAAIRTEAEHAGLRLILKPDETLQIQCPAKSWLLNATLDGITPEPGFEGPTIAGPFENWLEAVQAVIERVREIEPAKKAGGQYVRAMNPVLQAERENKGRERWRKDVIGAQREAVAI